jgi:hypothetical protein
VFILRSFSQKRVSMIAVSLIASIAALASCATTDQNLRRDVIYKCGEEDCSPLIAAKRIFKLGKAYSGAAVIRAFLSLPKPSPNHHHYPFLFPPRPNLLWASPKPGAFPFQKHPYSPVGTQSCVRDTNPRIR